MSIRPEAFAPVETESDQTSPAHRRRDYGRAAKLLLGIGLAGVGLLVLGWVAQRTHLRQVLPHYRERIVAAMAPGLETQPTASSSKQRFRLDIEIIPAQANLYLDGELASNPLRLPYPLDASAHEFRAEAAGYLSETIRVKFDRDLLVVLSLARAPETTPESAD